MKKTILALIAISGISHASTLMAMDDGYHYDDRIHSVRSGFGIPVSEIAKTCSDMGWSLYQKGGTSPKTKDIMYTMQTSCLEFVNQLPSVVKNRQLFYAIDASKTGIFCDNISNKYFEMAIRKDEYWTYHDQSTAFRTCMNTVNSLQIEVI